MGNGDIVVGKKFGPVRHENHADRTVAPAPIQATPGNEDRHCGAMSQQRGDGGAVSTPQKFVRLVGCRNPRARPSGGR